MKDFFQKIIGVFYCRFKPWIEQREGMWSVGKGFDVGVNIVPVQYFDIVRSARVHTFDAAVNEDGWWRALARIG